MRGFRAWLALALLALAGCVGLSTPAPVPEGWQLRAPGLLYRHEPAQGLHALRVDLQQLRLRLSSELDKGLPLDARDDARAALAAFNAAFFDRNFRVRGLHASEGQAWPEPMSPQDSPLLACDAAQRCALQLEPPYALPAGTHTAAAGTPWLLRQGRPRTAQDDARCAAFCARTHPRTALGLSADGRQLIVLLAEGRREGVPGLSLADTAAVLLRLGAHEAINLDGGGSSALLLDGVAVMQRPANEPAQRRIANVLLIEARR